MELSDFIALTLGEIMSGVSKAAQSHSSADLGGNIAPQAASRIGDPDQMLIREVEFDIAITSESTSDKSKSGGMNVKVIEADLTSASSKRLVGESRVKFSVPISLPYTRIIDL